MWSGRPVLMGPSRGEAMFIGFAVRVRPGWLDALVAGAGFGSVAVLGGVGFAGGSTALASGGFDEAVDFAVAALDVGV